MLVSQKSARVADERAIGNRTNGPSQLPAVAPRSGHDQDGEDHWHPAAHEAAADGRKSDIGWRAAGVKCIGEHVEADPPTPATTLVSTGGFRYGSGRGRPETEFRVGFGSGRPPPPDHVLRQRHRQAHIVGHVLRFDRLGPHHYHAA